MLPVLSEESEQNVPRSVLGSGGMERRSSAMASGQFVSVSASNHQEFRKGQCSLLGYEDTCSRMESRRKLNSKVEHIIVPEPNRLHATVSEAWCNVFPSTRSDSCSNITAKAVLLPCKTLFHGDGTQHPSI